MRAYNRQLNDDSPVFSLDWATECAGRVFLASLSSSVSVEEGEVYRRRRLQALSLTGPARGTSNMSGGLCHSAEEMAEGKERAKNGEREKGRKERR